MAPRTAQCLQNGMHAQGLDWREPQANACNAGLNPIQNLFYDGINVNPLEVLFIKVISQRPNMPPYNAATNCKSAADRDMGYTTKVPLHFAFHSH
ncbi:hypothetical protein MMC07_002629 [Pseudocyphellaria aurata]|nr:hypothetical protein [Pseudocyphellaria aurata]